MTKLKVEKTHPHGEKCEDFQSALNWGFIVVIAGEPQIAGRLPKTAKAVNAETGEKYNPSDFMLNLIIEFCPFCGERIFEKPLDEPEPDMESEW